MAKCQYIDFDITTVERQRDVLTSILFIVFLDVVTATTMTTYPTVSVKMQYRQEGPLVGSKRKAKEKIIVMQCMTLSMQMTWLW